MFESLTFFTLLSSAPAVLKFAHDALNFYTRVKALRSQPSRPLVQAGSFTKVERRQLEGMYAAIDDARPVAADIAARALRFYTALGALIAAVIVLASVLLLQIPDLPWGVIGSMALIMVGGLAIISVLPSPVPRVLSVLNDARVQERLEAAVNSLSLAWRDVASSTRISVRAAGVSIPERVFLDTYFKANAIVRVLECGLLVTELETGIRTAHQTLTGRVFDVGYQIVYDLAQGESLKDPETRQAVLSREFAAVGLQELVNPELVGNEFFNLDFQKLAAQGDLREHLEGYWSSQSRRLGRR